MAYEGSFSRTALREQLSTRYNREDRQTEILLGQEVIGHMVTYGKKNMLRVPASGLRPTVYNGRVVVNGIRLSVEASKPASLLNALAAQIGKELKAEKARAPASPDAHQEAVLGNPVSLPKP